MRTRKIFDEPAYVGYEVVIDVYPDEDSSAAGYSFDVTMQLTEEGWAADEVTVQTICALGVDPADRSTCR